MGTYDLYGHHGDRARRLLSRVGSTAGVAAATGALVSATGLAAGSLMAGTTR